MGKASQKSSFLLKVLLAINIILLSGFAYSQYSQHKTQNINNLDLSVLEYITKSFIHDYNRRDLDALYNNFSPVAKDSLIREKVDADFNSLFSDFLTLSEHKFVRSEYITDHENKKVYKIIYEVSCEQLNNKNNNCELKLTLAYDNNYPEFFGITLTEKP